VRAQAGEEKSTEERRGGERRRGGCGEEAGEAAELPTGSRRSSEWVVVLCL